MDPCSLEEQPRAAPVFTGFSFSTTKMEKTFVSFDVLVFLKFHLSSGWFFFKRSCSSLPFAPSAFIPVLVVFQMLHKERLVPFIFSSPSEDFAPDSAEKYYFSSTNNFYFTPSVLKNRFTLIYLFYFFRVIVILAVLLRTCPKVDEQVPMVLTWDPGDLKLYPCGASLPLPRLQVLGLLRVFEDYQLFCFDKNTLWTGVHVILVRKYLNLYIYY